MKMRNEELEKLYSLRKKPEDIDVFNFDRMTHPPILSFITDYEVGLLRSIVTSPKITMRSARVKAINNILNPKGFIQMAAGTNRIVYRHVSDESIVLKVAIDEIGMRDSPAEMINQEYLKPFIPKVFDVTPCGTLGLFERVKPIRTREEFASVAGDVFDLIASKIIGKYILEDIGTEYFKNYGLRDNFGPVLIDFPYLYELDSTKLHCTKLDNNGVMCNGEIDYDVGFNILICNKCKTRYAAKSLRKVEGLSAIDNPLLKEERQMKKKAKFIIEEIYDDGRVVTNEGDLDVIDVEETIQTRKPRFQYIPIRDNKPNRRVNYRQQMSKRRGHGFEYFYEDKFVETEEERKERFESIVKQDKKKEVVKPAPELKTETKEEVSIDPLTLCKNKFNSLLNNKNKKRYYDYAKLITALSHLYNIEMDLAINLIVEDFFKDIVFKEVDKGLLDEIETVINQIEEAEKESTEEVVVEKPVEEVVEEILKEVPKEEIPKEEDFEMEVVSNDKSKVSNFWNENSVMNKAHKATMNEKNSLFVKFEDLLIEILSKPGVEINKENVIKFVVLNSKLDPEFSNITNVDEVAKQWFENNDIKSVLDSHNEIEDEKKDV